MKTRSFILAAGVALGTVFVFSCSSDNWDEDTFTDERDGKKYRTVVIGSQTWMAENLNYEAEGSLCYENKPANCAKYGRLYDWNMAMEACPEGWILPSSADWDKLYRFADPEGVGYYESKAAGKFLKAKKGWIIDNGIDKYGFSALPGGYSSSNGSYFDNILSIGRWWTSDEYKGNDNNEAHYRSMNFTESASWSNDNKSSYLYSVRCIKDLPAP